MDFSHYTDNTVAMAVDLVNTRNPVSGNDDLTDVAGLRRFLATYEGEWHGADWGIDSIGEADVAEVRELRARLRAVFSAQDPEEAAALLNEILRDVAATPRISVHGEAEPHLHFEPLTGRPAQWLGAATAMGLGVVLCDRGLERFGTCAAHDCVDVYVDTSRNRSRRHCSQSCTTRDNVAAYRARARAAAE